MKIYIVGLQKAALVEYIQQEFPADFELLSEEAAAAGEAEVIVCYGGDGTLLYGERLFPGTPKVMIRNSQVCHLCSNEARETILQLLIDGSYSTESHMKLEVEAKGEVLTALNDIIIGHSAVNGTLRALVYVNGQQYGDELFGDGVVISTPIGSTGYYQSITRSNFHDGIGIAFNNTVNVVSHLVVAENSDIQVEITRGPGMVAADNNQQQVQLTVGERATIRRSAHSATIVRFDGEELQRFNVNTGSDRVPLGKCQLCRKPINFVA